MFSQNIPNWNPAPDVTLATVMLTLVGHPVELYQLFWGVGETMKVGVSVALTVGMVNIAMVAISIDMASIAEFACLFILLFSFIFGTLQFHGSFNYRYGTVPYH